MQMEQSSARPRRGLLDRLSRAPVFWQHFSLLVVILILASFIQVFSSVWYADMLTESYLKQAENSFYKNCDVLASSISGAYSLPAAMESTADYETLQRAAAGQIPKTSIGLALNGIRGRFSDALSRSQNRSNNETFLYFPFAGALCTRSRVFPAAEDCFEGYILYDGWTAEELLDKCRSSEMISYIPCTSVAIDGGKGTETITLLLRSSRSGTVMGLLLPAKQVRDALRISDLPDDTYLQISAATGEIYAHGSEVEGETYHELSHTLRGVGWKATIGIPHAYFSAMTRPMRMFSVMLLGLTLLVGLALCVLFSSMGSRPLRKLLSAYAAGGETSEQRNELMRLAELLASAQLRTQEVNQILSFNLLVRVFSGGVLTQEDEARLLESYPILNAPCRVAIVHTAVPNEAFEQPAVTELLREHLPESFAAATVSRLESGILLPDDTDALHELAVILDGVNSQLKIDGLSALCGVSAPFTGAHGAYAAVRQARFSVPIRETSIIEVFSAEENGERRPGVFSWLTHEKLYQAIMNNDEEGTLAFLRDLAADRHAPGDVREVFYGVRFVLRSTARELNLPLPEADTLEYHEEMRAKENFRQMEELVRTLFDRMRARKELNAEKLSESVVAYIAESFSNSDLGATEIANRFALPVKAVYAAVREQTGQSLGDYLTTVRMKEAARLLCTTTESVDAIAAACGYPAQSTFYRVFKKYYGESPNRYRSLH